MQIKTEVKATINQIKQLIAEKYNIGLDFDLEIVDEIVQVGNFVGKKEEQPKWYPDDSGKWIEVGTGQPHDLDNHDSVEYLTAYERDTKNFKPFPLNAGRIYWDCDLEDTNRIVAYKKVK